MSTREGSGERERSVQGYSATMQHLQDVSTGMVPMQHPGAPKFRKGRPYITNSEEDAFSASSKKRLAVRALVVSWLGFATPWILAFRRNPEKFTQMLSTTPVTKLPVFRWSLFGGFTGLVVGERLYRPLIMKDGLKLRNSPMAKEARYMLWKMDPKHPLLLEDGVRGLDDFEFEIANNSSRSSSAQGRPMSIKELATARSDEAQIREQKRRRFYEGRGQMMDFSSEVFNSDAFNPQDGFDHSDRFDLSDMFDNQPNLNRQL